MDNYGKDNYNNQIIDKSGDHELVKDAMGGYYINHKNDDKRTIVAKFQGGVIDETALYYAKQLWWALVEIDSLQ